MEINILEESKNRLVFELKGATHTICNALRHELSEDSNVKITSYRIEHPLINIPQIMLETTGKNPRDVLIDAAKHLQKKGEKFKAEFIKKIK